MCFSKAGAYGAKTEEREDAVERLLRLRGELVEGQDEHVLLRHERADALDLRRVLAARDVGLVLVRVARRERVVAQALLLAGEALLLGRDRGAEVEVP